MNVFQAHVRVYRLLFYTPSAAVVRLLTTNFLIAYITSWVLYAYFQYGIFRLTLEMFHEDMVRVQEDFEFRKLSYNFIFGLKEAMLTSKSG